MRIEFTVPTQSFSINRASTRDVRYKSSDYKTWYLHTKTLIEEADYYKSLLDFAEHYKQMGGGLRMKIEIVYPHWFFYNKQGQISAKTQDVSNFEKLLIDLIIQDVMNLNDKNILELYSSKRAGATYLINVEIGLA